MLNAIDAYGVQSIVISAIVCLSVRLCVCPFTYLENHNLPNRGSVLLRHSYHRLGTSGFVDGVMFSHDGL